MKGKIIKILQYLLGGIGFIVVLPFALLYFIATMFWVFFGTTLIAFITIMLLGGTDEQCITYAPALGLLISIIKKFQEVSKK
jgi:hypothetical protein